MSYRSTKRILGETSLERKCRFLFGLCLFTLITGSFWWYSVATQDQVYEASRRSCRYLATTALEGIHFVEWAESDDEMKPVAEQLLKALEEDAQFQWSILRPSDDSRRPSSLPGRQGFGGPSKRPPDYVGRPQSKFEVEALRAFQSDDPPPFKENPTTIDNEAVYEYYWPVYVTDHFCITCHNTLHVHGGDMHVGQLMDVVKITLPDAEAQGAFTKNRAILLGAAFITVFLAMIASWAIVRYVIVKPLKHLRDVSDQVGHGNIALRADLHTGDEFEELAVAFNRMLRQLNSNQDELRDVNDSLNQKVDELAQVNMRLYDMNRMKSDFLATMSHELRTPLNAIIGFSDVLESIASLDDKQKRYVKNIQTSGKVLLEMINDILDLAKIESGKMEVRLSDFSIAPVVQAQCDMARPLSERKNIDLNCEIEPGLPDMFQDQAKVQQILNNLLSNAIKFTPEGGRITVSAKRADRDDLLLSVADTGVGISREDQVSIFEKFRQGKSVLSGGDAMTREYSGTGLGLSIVKELCKLLGGEISLDSELGKGSKFTVSLPWSRTEQPRLDAALAVTGDGATKPQRLLLPQPASTTVAAD